MKEFNIMEMRKYRELKNMGYSYSNGRKFIFLYFCFGREEKFKISEIYI